MRSTEPPPGSGKPAEDRPPPPEPPPLPPTDPTLQVDGDGIGWITFDAAGRKANILNLDVMNALSERIDELDRLAAAGQVRAAVVWSGKESFITGADVDAIADVEDPAEGEAACRAGQAVYGRLEKLPIPTVAAIHGLCLGGGTEMSLACRFRLVSDSERTKIGLPEVQLGILPAWGGTTRLPRLVGLQAALDMLLTGNTISASKARRIGFASEILPAALFREEVAHFALRAADLPPGSSRQSRKLLSRLMEDTAPGRRVILSVARRRVMERTAGHYPAPLKILEVLRKHLGSSVERSLAAEARAAGELIASSVCKNLIHVFHLRERARKDAGVAPGTKGRSVAAVGVLGAGVMGGGIAQLAAYHDLLVRMKDIKHEAVAGGLQHARSLFDQAVAKKKLRPREAERKMELISGGLEYHGFRTVDVVVEAVVERLDVKRSVLREVEAAVDETCVIATNTSSLRVDAMAEALERPERFAGMHFFNPVHRMPLVEVVRGARTDDESAATLHGLAVALGKVPLVCGDGPGFVVNRVLVPYLNEAGWLLADGATIQQVDRAALDFGMPMGPLRLVDEIGVDIGFHAVTTLHGDLGDRMAPSPPMAALAATDRLGHKNGRGFYRYEQGSKPEVDEAVYGELGSAVPPGSDRGLEGDGRDIRARLVLAMVNEAARVLADRVVSRAADIDLGMIMGTGFPPFRGGLLRFADTLHARQVVSRLEELTRTHGTRFEPAPMLVELARSDQGFYDAFGG